MKVVASIMMYSGMQNPERDLSEDEVKHILELLSKIDQPNDKGGHSKLGFSGYCVSWAQDENITELEAIPLQEQPPIYVMTFEENNTIGIYKNMLMSAMSMYHDTAGVNTYLKEIMASTLQKHMDDATEAMAKYNEDLLGTTK